MMDHGWLNLSGTQKAEDTLYYAKVKFQKVDYDHVTEKECTNGLSSSNLMRK